MMVWMFDYEFKVEYRFGKMNIFDYILRYLLFCENCIKKELGIIKDVKYYVNFVFISDIFWVISKEELVKLMGNDEEL